MKFINRIGRLILLAVFVFGFAEIAQAQLTSNTASVNLSMSVSESLTISASPANITFNYSSSGGGTATASGPITVVASANIAAGHNVFVVAGWLSSVNAALSGPQNIPSSEVFANTTGNGAWSNGGIVPCTGAATGVNALGVNGTQCGSVGGTQDYLDGMLATTIGAGGAFVLTDSVTLSLANLGSLTPGSYSGVINFQAEVM